MIRVTHEILSDMTKWPMIFEYKVRARLAASPACFVGLEANFAASTASVASASLIAATASLASSSATPALFFKLLLLQPILHALLCLQQ